MSDIIILATARFNNPYSSTAVSLAVELSKTNRVFFIDNPYTIKDVLFGSRIRTKNDSDQLRYVKRIKENLWQIIVLPVISINWLSSGRVYNLMSKINEKIFYRRVKSLIKKFDINDFVLLNIFNPYYFSFEPTWFNPKLRVYYSVDSMSSAQYFSKHGVKKENKAINEYDIILATSKQLYKDCLKRNPQTYYLPNGANYDLFSTAVSKKLNIPDDLEKIPEPRIVYVGNIDSRLDVKLLQDLISENPEYNLVFIGPVNTSEILKVDRNRFHFLGSKDIALLPAYLKYCQCAIIPFRRNDFTKSIYPLKINEYLAAGLPTVTTYFSSSIDEFGDTVYSCDSNLSFIRFVEESMENNSAELIGKRQKFASQNSWESRSLDLLNILNKAEDTK